MTPLTEQRPTPFLNLITTEINGWVMALCPEFEVSACGPNRDTVVEDLYDMIKRNASLVLEEKEGNPPYLIEWSAEIVKQKDISVLFKR